MESLDTITVTVMKRGELQAVHTDLYVKVQGASVVSEGQALEKVREVAQPVRELTSVGLPPEDVHLQGATADVSSGAAECSGRHHVPEEHFPEPDRMGYPDEEALKDEWLSECAARAHEKARRIAASLGVRLTGLHRFTEAYQDREDSRVPEPPAMRWRGRGGGGRLLAEPPQWGIRRVS